MPRIQQYNSPVSGLRPNESGAEAANRAARVEGFLGDEGARMIGGTISRVGQQVGQKLDQHETMEEISQGAPSFAQLVDKQNKTWNQLGSSTDLNDTTIADKYREQTLEPALDKWMEGFHTEAGQRWAQAHADAFRQHMFEKTSADMMTRAGDAAIVNVHQTISGLSNAAQSDFSSLDHLIQLNHSAVGALAANAGLSADQNAKLRTAVQEDGDKKIVIAGFQGLILSKPEAAITALQSAKYDKYLTGEEKTTLVKFAEQQSHMQVEQQRANEAHVEHENVQQANTAANAVTASLVSKDGSTLVVPHDYFSNVTKIAMMPNSPPGLAKSMLDMGQRIRKESVGEASKGVTDPTTYSDLQHRMMLPPTDPNALTMQQVYEARAAGKINDHDFQFFRGYVTEAQKDPQKVAAYKQLNTFLQSFKTSITKANPMLGSLDPQGDQRFGQFEHDMTTAFEQGYANGTWRNMLNPRDPAYLGRYLPNYQGNTKAGVAGMVKTLTEPVTLAPAAPAPNEAKRMPGETAAEFLKRTGG